MEGWGSKGHERPERVEGLSADASLRGFRWRQSGG